MHLGDNILKLHQELRTKVYRHGAYTAFKINDPKPRHIHKASIADRLVHHALYRILYIYFDKKFIFDSYSCRVNKGTHRAIQQFEIYARKTSRNYHRTVWILKCDVRKFFASIDHNILKEILSKEISDPDVINLLCIIIDSFQSEKSTEGNPTGLPLGNLTSQLLVNVYMNRFDQFVKRELKIKYYIRYADDFVFLHKDKTYLEEVLQRITIFLKKQLKLSLHPDKVSLKTFSSGINFLGWVHFPHHRVLRTSTKRRMLRNLNSKASRETYASYRGLLTHGNTYKLNEKIHKTYGRDIFTDQSDSF